VAFNLLVILSVVKNRNLRAPLDEFIASLALVDVITGLAGMPITVIIYHAGLSKLLAHLDWPLFSLRIRLRHPRLLEGAALVAMLRRADLPQRLARALHLCGQVMPAFYAHSNMQIIHQSLFPLQICRRSPSRSIRQIEGEEEGDLEDRPLLVALNFGAHIRSLLHTLRSRRRGMDSPTPPDQPHVRHLRLPRPSHDGHGDH